MGPGGIYGEPIGTRGVSRVEVEDIALAVVKVAEEPERWKGMKIMVGSKQLYTGLDQLEKHLSSAIDPMWGRDIRLMYELCDKMEFGMTDEEYSMQKELLGKNPSSYEEFVKKIASQWRKELS
ncbi:MAG: hypothetical protein Q9199_005476 [Rusavskia elegans]